MRSASRSWRARAWRFCPTRPERQQTFADRERVHRRAPPRLHAAEDARPQPREQLAITSTRIVEKNACGPRIAALLASRGSAPRPVLWSTTWTRAAPRRVPTRTLRISRRRFVPKLPSRIWWAPDSDPQTGGGDPRGRGGRCPRPKFGMPPRGVPFCTRSAPRLTECELSGLVRSLRAWLWGSRLGWVASPQGWTRHGHILG
jgi:hypothetical protein